MKITTLFLDIGGVILTNGWDRHCREKAAQQFGIDYEEYENKHKEYYNLHETGRLSLEEYLKKSLLWKDRNFSLQQFKDFMYSQSKPIPDMINFLFQIKEEYALRISFVSNEGRELAEYRIKTFNLKKLGDDFFISCFVGYQKPDPHIYQMALDVTQTALNEVLYIDDRPNLIEAAQKIGLQSVENTNFDVTTTKILSLLKT